MIAFQKHFLRVALAVIFMTLHMVCDASPKKAVNILTRYNYLDSPEINSLVKNKCGVEISSDEYSGDAECFRRMNKAVGLRAYDIIIFPEEIYDLIKQQIKVKNSKLSEVAKKYNSHIKDSYLSCNYPNNVVYFMLSISGFIWDPKIVQISATDSTSSMFSKTKNNIVLLLSSHTALCNLIDDDKKLPRGSYVENFEKIIQDADVYIDEHTNKLYGKNNFAFAFQRSGAIVSAVNSSKNKSLSFLVHPKYSYVQPDLMTELNNKPETQCVARVLASKQALDIVQKKTYYLSPYSTYKSVDDPVFQSIYKPMFDNTCKMQRFNRFFFKNIKEYYEVDGIVDKIFMLPQIVKKHSFLKHKSE